MSEISDKERKERAEMRVLLDASKSTARKFARANGWHVSETAKPASRLSKASASNRFGCTEADGTSRYGSKVLRSYRKAPWSDDHLAQAKALGVTPKELQREKSRHRRERESFAKLTQWVDSINQS